MSSKSREDRDISPEKDMFKLLHERGADFSIHVAASVGNIESVKNHLANGVEINILDNVHQKTPHYYAINYKLMEFN